MEDNNDIYDSDDDLLGITDIPIDIRTQRDYKFPLGSAPPIDSIAQSSRISNFKQEIQRGPKLSSNENNDWVYHRHNRKIKENTNYTNTQPKYKSGFYDRHHKNPTSTMMNPHSTHKSFNSRPTDHLIEEDNNKSVNYDKYSVLSSTRDTQSKILELHPPRELSPDNYLGQEQRFLSPKIDINDYRTEQSQHKYQRLREIPDIIGFIVNVHDATNFDIDLEISPEIHEKYADVIFNQYTYQDLSSDFFDSSDLFKSEHDVPSIGTTYRCRLRGVGINQLSQHTHAWKSNKMCVEVKQLIDRTDGWITCTLSDIDVYQRLLVDIIINTCNGPVDLRDYLLTRMEGAEYRENPIFYPYSGKKDRNYNYNR